MSASSRSKAFPAVFSFIVNYFSTWGRGKVVAPRKKESPADSGPPPRVFRPEAASPSRDTPYQIAYDLLKAGWRRHQESVGRQLEATVPGKPFLHVYAPDDDPWSELNQTMASCLQGMEGDLAVEIQDALKKGSGLRDAHRFNNHLVSRYERSIW
ncbi:MAG: hypothetical protein GWM98_22225, partial [Nitrospinaceae bacterium]|nr:hypothetical protein [Nitrospinaceae bacterium]NIR56674.1 hypothetical protein [Nitrospinaceae bacterium]NIS87137.1 hypothetical protein [Nitrospinaceae bacterium]NIU46181.1 hypothetical protein [Nitrospinaceae bacterium]NIU98360.1 hypothetical protein [Nitrospinaceae bacterium]